MATHGSFAMLVDTHLDGVLQMSRQAHASCDEVVLRLARQAIDSELRLDEVVAHECKLIWPALHEDLPNGDDCRAKGRDYHHNMTRTSFVR